MPLPEDAIALVSRFCDERSTDDSCIEYTTRGSAITTPIRTASSGAERSPTTPFRARDAIDTDREVCGP
jgi:hypothetical protein